MIEVEEIKLFKVTLVPFEKTSFKGCDYFIVAKDKEGAYDAFLSIGPLTSGSIEITEVLQGYRQVQ